MFNATSETPRAVSRLLFAALTISLVGCSEATEPGKGDEPEEPQESGRWRQVRDHGAALTDEQRAEIERLEAIGYVQGSTRARGLEGVTIYDRERAEDGLNFFTSGHFPGAVLMDMEGRVLHTWELPFEVAWPEVGGDKSAVNRYYWRRAHLFENGDVLAIYEGIGICKVDASSRLLWARRNKAHHDFEVLPSGDIYVLTRTARVLPRVHRKKPTLEDFVTLLNSEGEEKHRASVLEYLERGGHPRIWESSKKTHGDVLHTNTLHVIHSEQAALHPLFEAGQLLIASPRVDLIALIDPEERRVVRVWQAGFVALHDPKILDNGNMLVFDNKGANGRSRVAELDPGTSRIVWQYRGTRDRPFYSRSCGGAERLEGGNTLITESDNGRAFEVSAEGEVVWEYRSPYRVGEDREYVATIFELLRLAPDFPIHWIDEAR